MPTSVENLALESVWFERSHYEKVEEQYVKFLTGGANCLASCKSMASSLPSPSNSGKKSSSLADEIARARQRIKHSLQCEDKSIVAAPAFAAKVGDGNVKKLIERVDQLETENQKLVAATKDLHLLIVKLETRIHALEREGFASAVNKTCAPSPSPKAASEPAVKKEDDDDDIDLFGSDDDEDEEKDKLHQERLKAYEAKKSKKPALIAKSNIILDVKPWDDETDMKKMEDKVRGIQMDGLVWGASKFVPLAFGIHKLQISCVVEDDKVSVDLLQEQIEGFEDLVQSVDIAAFNKV